jgi:hypothetical protein
MQIKSLFVRVISFSFKYIIHFHNNLEAFGMDLLRFHDVAIRSSGYAYQCHGLIGTRFADWAFPTVRQIRVFKYFHFSFSIFSLLKIQPGIRSIDPSFITIWFRIGRSACPG